MGNAHNFIDLSFRKFGNLLVIEYAGRKNRISMWKCKCDCGNEKLIMGKHLTNGRTKSCGCLKTSRSIKHGLSESNEYKIWNSMIQRCTNINNSAYHNYGGRGIIVCDRWLENFDNFYHDVGLRPSKKHSIERINNDGIYEPDNCVWATKTDQSRNTRVSSSSSTGYKGVHLYKKTGKFQAHIKIGNGNKRINLGTFESLVEAVNARKAAETKYWSD